MEALHARRAPLYEQVSTLTVPTDGLTPEQVAALVLVALGAQAPDTARALSAVARPGVYSLFCGNVNHDDISPPFFRNEIIVA